MLKYLRENVKNSGIHKKLKIVVYSELSGLFNFRYKIYHL
jgi:hypothetical protein